jgi:hypothetical protein
MHSLGDVRGVIRGEESEPARARGTRLSCAGPGAAVRRISPAGESNKSHSDTFSAWPPLDLRHSQQLNTPTLDPSTSTLLDYQQFLFCALLNCLLHSHSRTLAGLNRDRARPSLRLTFTHIN